ncbi:hypothetical protein F66182_5993 [Fusarium sp. NRRL 66182]|nr:hypothetical protein F66182_5993 [Fusarium sp. NRRL 66182]
MGDTNQQDKNASKGGDLTPVDIIVTRVMLTKGKKLPPGVVDIIFDFAEYWAHSSNEIDFQLHHSSPLRIEGTSPSQNKFILRSFPVGLTGIEDAEDEEALAEVLAYDLNEAKPRPLSKEHDPSYFAKLAKYPTPKLLHPVRKIVFSIRSKDQGWGGDAENRHTYNGAWTWFEAGLEKFDADQECDPVCTYDVRYKSASSKASPLPVCALRPLYPSIVPQDKSNDKYKFEHPLGHDERWTIARNKTAHRAWQDHVVTWSWRDDIQPETEAAVKLCSEHGRGEGTGDGWFVRDLKLGDVVTNWIDTLTSSLRLQSDTSHPFHKDPYALRSIAVQSFDRFGGNRLGFVKLTATVSNEAGETLPAAALLRGPSVAVLFMLIPDDVPPDSDERYVVLTVQPRVPAGSLSFVELPAGMVDDAGSFKGAAAQEIQEELGVTIHEDELTNLSERAAPAERGGEGLANAVFPSAGGCDEHITIFSYEKKLPREQIREWSGRLTGLRSHGEKITLKVVPMGEAWREGGRDAKCLAALALWQGLKQEKKLSLSL